MIIKKNWLCKLGIHKWKRQMDLAYNPEWESDGILGAAITSDFCEYCHFGRTILIDELGPDLSTVNITQEEAKKYLDSWFASQYHIFKNNNQLNDS